MMPRPATTCSFRSGGVGFEVSLREAAALNRDGRGMAPSRERADTCWRILEEFGGTLSAPGQQEQFSIILDELRRCIYSSQYFTPCPRGPETAAEGVERARLQRRGEVEAAINAASGIETSGIGGGGELGGGDWDGGGSGGQAVYEQLPYFEVARRLEEDNLDLQAELGRRVGDTDAVEAARAALEAELAAARAKIQKLEDTAAKHDAVVAGLERSVRTSRTSAYDELERYKLMERQFLELRSETEDNEKELKGCREVSRGCDDLFCFVFASFLHFVCVSR